MRVPNGDELRWLVHTSLAYGAQDLLSFQLSAASASGVSAVAVASFGGQGGGTGAPGEATPGAAGSTTLAPRPRGEILPAYPFVRTCASQSNRAVPVSGWPAARRCEDHRNKTGPPSYPAPAIPIVPPCKPRFVNFADYQPPRRQNICHQADAQGSAGFHTLS